jgi:hypothetical protein
MSDKNFAGKNRQIIIIIIDYYQFLYYCKCMETQITKNRFFNTIGSPFLSEFSSVPYPNRPSIVLKNTAISTKNSIFPQNVWRFKR